MKFDHLLILLAASTLLCHALIAQSEIPVRISDEEYEKTKFLIFTRANDYNLHITERQKYQKLIEPFVVQAAMREDGETFAALFWEGRGNIFLLTIEAIHSKLNPILKAKMLLAVLPDESLWIPLDRDRFKKHDETKHLQVRELLKYEVNKLLNTDYTPDALQDDKTRKIVSERIRLKLAEMATDSNQSGMAPAINSPQEKGPAENSDARAAVQEKPQPSVASPVNEATKPSSPHFPVVLTTIVTVLIIGVTVFRVRRKRSD